MVSIESASEIETIAVSPYRYSICTLVTKPAEYRDMVASFSAKGFSFSDCEYIYIDNSSLNKQDGFSGLNSFLSEASGDYLIICHQDILLLDDDRVVLDGRLAELTSLDPYWGVCGNAGCTSRGDRVIRISDAYGTNTRRGPFPSAVTSLDENFLIVRRRANLGLSPHFKGFHLYAAELCAVAAFLGRKCYVLDFHLLHKGQGDRDRSFYAIRNAITQMRSRQMRPKVLSATGAESAIFISGWPLLDWIGNRLLRVSRLRRSVFAFARALHG